MQESNPATITVLHCKRNNLDYCRALLTGFDWQDSKRRIAGQMYTYWVPLISRQTPLSLEYSGCQNVLALRLYWVSDLEGVQKQFTSGRFIFTVCEFPRLQATYVYPQYIAKHS